MLKKYFKDLKMMGNALCIYNVNKTANCNIYTYLGATYFKPPRQKAKKAIEINGVKNLVACKGAKIGVKNVFIEI